MQYAISQFQRTLDQTLALLTVEFLEELDVTASLQAPPFSVILCANVCPSPSWNFNCYNVIVKEMNELFDYRMVALSMYFFSGHYKEETYAAVLNQVQTLVLILKIILARML